MNNQYGKGSEFHGIFRIVAIVLIAAVIVGAILFTVQFLQSGKDGGGKDTKKTVAVAGTLGILETKTAAAETGTPTVTETGKIEVPADAWILEVKSLSPGTLSIKKFPIGETPTSIWVQQRFTIFEKVKISAKEISGIAISERNTNTGTQSSIWIYFYKNNNFIKGFVVNTDPGIGSGNKFKMEFPEEVWEADSVGIIAKTDS